MRRRLIGRTALLVAVVLVAGACSRSGTTSPGGADATTYALELGSTDLYVGGPQRVQVGVFRSTPQGGVQPIPRLPSLDGKILGIRRDRVWQSFIHFTDTVAELARAAGG